MGWSEKDKAEIAAWRIPVVGDTMRTPTGFVKVASVTKCTWTSDNVPGRPGYGNVPFYEGGDWRHHYVVNPDGTKKEKDPPIKKSFLQRLFGH